MNHDNIHDEQLRILKGPLNDLLAYCRKNNWSGFDPYDGLNSRIFLATPFSKSKLCRIVMIQLMKRLPINLRPMLLVPRLQNPKAIALFLAALVKLARVQLLPQGELIGEMTALLSALRSPDSEYCCWGYCFPWQTRGELVPRGTANLVCTVFVANALLDVYEYSRDPECLGMAASAADYILDELYWTEGDAVACFSYPLPGQHVPIHNANFLAAALLCRIGRYGAEKSRLDAALRVARYSAAKQRPDGSWGYGELPVQGWVDNFHTGFNLCALRTISRYAGTDEFEPHIRMGFDFYREHFFTENGAPRYFHNRTYPIDIHSVAQSVITLLELRDLRDANLQYAFSVAKWALDHMWDQEGYFYYQVFPLLTNRISYMRWSQAWMLLALSTLVEHVQQNALHEVTK